MMKSANRQLQRSLFNAAAQFTSVQRKTHTSLLKHFGWDAWKPLHRLNLNGSFPSFWIGAQRHFFQVEATCLEAADPPGPDSCGNKKFIDARPSVSPWLTDHSSMRGNKGSQSTDALPISRNFSLKSHFPPMALELTSTSTAFTGEHSWDSKEL